MTLSNLRLFATLFVLLGLWYTHTWFTISFTLFMVSFTMQYLFIFLIILLFILMYREHNKLLKRNEFFHFFFWLITIVILLTLYLTSILNILGYPPDSLISSNHISINIIYNISYKQAIFYTQFATIIADLYREHLINIDQYEMLLLFITQTDIKLIIDFDTFSISMIKIYTQNLPFQLILVDQHLQEMNIFVDKVLNPSKFLSGYIIIRNILFLCALLKFSIYTLPPMLLSTYIHQKALTIVKLVIFNKADIMLWPYLLSEQVLPQLVIKFISFYGKNPLIWKSTTEILLEFLANNDVPSHIIVDFIS